MFPAEGAIKNLGQKPDWSSPKARNKIKWAYC